MFNRVNPAARLALTALLCLCCAPALGAEPAARVKVDGTPYYIDESKTHVEGDVAIFRLYTSAEASDPGAECSLNCVTREFSARTGEQWSTPFKILPGESLYPVGKKLCDWDEKGFFRKYLF